MTGRGMLTSGRLSLSRLYLVAAFFVGTAPVFWLMTEIRRGEITGAYENSDLYQDIYPSFHYGFESLRSGRMPLWNPMQLCGTSFQADPRVSLFQPLNAVFLWLPTARAMAFHALLCLSLMGFFFVLFTRSVGLRYLPAVIGGIAYAFCGASAGAISRPAMANALAWTPAVFWAVGEYARRFRFGAAVLAGIGLAMLMLSGAPALGVASACLAIAYGAWMAISRRGIGLASWAQVVVGLPAVVIVGAVISAVQWLPTMSWLGSLEDPWAVLWSINHASRAPATMQELVMQMLTSNAGTVPRMGYVGIGTLLFLPAGVFHRPARRDTVFFGLAAALCLMVYFWGGRSLPLGFPPLALSFPLAFCLAVLSAIGADRLLAPRQSFGWHVVWPAACSVLTLAGLLCWMTGALTRGYTLVFVAVVMTFLALRTRWAATLSSSVLAAVLFVDLVAANSNAYSHPYKDAPACYRRYASAVLAAQEEARGARVVISATALDPGLPANLGMLYPVRLVGGRSLGLTKEQAAWWKHLGWHAGELANAVEGEGRGGAEVSRLLNFMAVRVLLCEPTARDQLGFRAIEGPQFVTRRQVDGLRLFVNKEVLPRAYWTPAWRKVEGVDAAIRALLDPAFDDGTTCVVEGSPGGLSDPVAAEQSERRVTRNDASCSVEDVSPERVVVRVNAPQPGVVVLADTFADGWQATCDAAPCPILRANGMFRGVAVSSGPHVITFEYRPKTYTTGCRVSLVGLGLAAIGGMVGFFRGPNDPRVVRRTGKVR